MFCDVFSATANGAQTAAGVWAKRGQRVDESIVFRSAGSLQEAAQSPKISLDILRICALELKSGLGTVTAAEGVLACCRHYVFYNVPGL